MSSRGQVAVDRDDGDENTIVAIESERCSVTLFLADGADAQEVRDLLEDAEHEASWHVPGGSGR